MSTGHLWPGTRTTPPDRDGAELTESDHRRHPDGVTHRPVSEGYRDDPDDIFDPTSWVLAERTSTGRASMDRATTGQAPMELHTRVTAERTARDHLEAFDPRRANLERDLSADEAVDHLAERTRQHSRLAAVADQDPCVQRVYAALDQGRFHGTTRHEGGVSPDEHLARLLRREDPAQLDEDKRARAVDAYRKGNQRHLCPEYSTSIADPVAYAVALARGVEHPDVRTALEATPDPPRKPRYVQVPIAELLGPDGHRLCTGYQLVGDDLKQATKDRDAYLKAQWRQQPTDLPPPQAERVDTFEDGVIEFRFVVNDRKSRYELTTMFPKPYADPPDEDLTRR